MPTDPLAALMGLQANNDAQIAAPGVRRQLRRDMGRNLYFQQQDPQNFGSGATPFDMQDLEDDILMDPETGVEAVQQTRRVQGQNQEIQDFNRPELAEMRGAQQGFELQKLLAPIHAKGGYDLAGREITAQGQVGAAEARGRASTATTDAVARRTAANANRTTQRQLQVQRNAQLGRQADMAEKEGDGLLGWLGLSNKNTKRAAELRAQQDFGMGGEADGAVDAETFAYDLFNEYPDASEAEILSIIEQQRTADTSDAEIQAVLQTYRSLAGR